MTEGTHKLSYIQLKDKVKGHGAKFKGIHKFISMNNYNRYIYLTVTLFQTYLHFLMLLCNWDLQNVKVIISYVSVCACFNGTIIVSISVYHAPV